MTSKPRFTRRAVLAGTGAAVASPYIWTSAQAQAGGAIKIGMPLALTGPLGSVGQQHKRGAEFYAKVQNAKGGILGRKIELLIEDTAGNPATCVRKAQEMVERHGVPPFHRLTLSSEALAVVPKLAEWNAIFVSGINGDGRLTAESFVPNFFRANTSGPMGARAVSLYLREAKAQELLCAGARLCLGPQQRPGVRERDEARQEELHRQGVCARPAPRTTRPTSPRSASRAPTRVLSRAGRRRQQRVPGAGRSNTSSPAKVDDADRADRAGRAARRRRRLRRSGRLRPATPSRSTIRPTRSSSSCGRRSTTARFPTRSRASSGRPCR